MGRIGMTGTSPTGDQDGQKLKSEVLWWVRRGGSWLQTEGNDLRSFFFFSLVREVLFNFSFEVAISI